MTIKIRHRIDPKKARTQNLPIAPTLSIFCHFALGIVVQWDCNYTKNRNSCNLLQIPSSQREKVMHVWGKNLY